MFNRSSCSTSCWKITFNSLIETSDGLVADLDRLEIVNVPFCPLITEPFHKRCAVPVFANVAVPPDADTRVPVTLNVGL